MVHRACSFYTRRTHRDDNELSRTTHADDANPPPRCSGAKSNEHYAATLRSSRARENCKLTDVAATRADDVESMVIRYVTARAVCHQIIRYMEVRLYCRKPTATGLHIRARGGGDFVPVVPIGFALYQKMRLRVIDHHSRHLVHIHGTCTLHSPHGDRIARMFHLIEPVVE